MSAKVQTQHFVSGAFGSEVDLKSKLKEIPTLSAVAAQLNQMLRDPQVSTKRIVEVLSTDQVLVSQILKVANSSYYAVPGGVKNIQKALNFMGMNTITQMVLGVSVHSLFKERKSANFSLTEFWRHALGVAVCAQVIAKRTRLVDAEEAFTAGLLHDVGKLGLYQANPSAFDTLVTLARETNGSFYANEGEMNHAVLGAILGEMWGLPPVLRTAIRYHHAEESELEAVNFLQGDAKPMIRTVRLANAIVNEQKIGASGSYHFSAAPAVYWTSLEMKPTDAATVVRDLKTNFDKMGAFFDVYR